MKVSVIQSCPTLCGPMDCRSPASSVHGILQARILEWVAYLSPGGTSGKECLPMQETRDSGLMPGSGRSPGGWNGNPLQYSCLENPMDRGAWQAPAHRGAYEWDTTEAT